MIGQPYRPTPLEVASGLIFGLGPPESLPMDSPGSPIEALEQAILPALLRPPCLVSFSGGRDSSTILAAAVRLARREGLELPIPATNRFPGAEGSDESEWQENVVVHLGLTDWVRFEFDGELDLVGPIAMRVLRRHGLLWPFNAHFHMPLIEEATGGSLITGVGGDEALGMPRWGRAAAVLAGRVRPRPRDVLAVGLAASPPALRRAVLARREPSLLPWLRPAAQREVWARWTADTASEPLRWQQRFAWWRRSRYVRIGLDSLARMAAELRVEVRSPFVEPGFSAALAALPADRRVFSRTSAMREFFGELLPPELLARRTKSHFDQAFWNRHSRALAEEWDEGDVDPAVVDSRALREQWSLPIPDARSFFLLQSVALAREGRSVARQLAEAVGSLS
jgi:asparagine synthetase B (glutamine-hydrolysing)